ncbi:MAG: hypothetical protein MUF66_01025 [Gammaproteobacteria bacterium]|jgi:hypothetical protein|nr:hypothetical protein [Gammaproteobacteria bacterium]
MSPGPERTARGGYDYHVGNAQLRAFARLSALDRLRWLDQARLITLLGRTPETAERQERLRRGEAIVNG